MVAPDLMVSVTVAFGLFRVPCAWAVVKVIKADKTASASIFFIVFFFGEIKDKDNEKPGIYLPS